MSVNALWMVSGRLTRRQCWKLYVRRLEAAREALADKSTRIDDAWKKFLNSPARSDSGPSTLQQYKTEWLRFERWLKQHHPDIKSLSAAADHHAQAYAGTFAGAAASTFNQHIGFLALLWRVLKVPRSPWDGIRRRRIAAIGRRELTIEELRTICAAADGEMRLLIALGIYTGMRLADCCLLEWSEVDLVRGLIRRVPVKTARRTNRPVIIPIHPALRRLLGKSRRGGYVVPDLAAKYKRDRSNVTSKIKAIFTQCGIKTVADNPGRRATVVAGFHSFRHTFVSMCRVAGAPLSVDESLVGHSSPAMTRHYTHTGDEAAAAAVGMLPELVDTKTKE